MPSLTSLARSVAPHRHLCLCKGCASLIGALIDADGDNCDSGEGPGAVRAACPICRVSITDSVEVFT